MVRLATAGWRRPLHSIDNEANSRAIAAAGAMAALLGVMRGPHAANRAVVARACGALGVIARISKEECGQAVHDAGGVPALLSSLQGE